MTGIVHIRNAPAHPVRRWRRETLGLISCRSLDKVLPGSGARVVDTRCARVRPGTPAIRRAFLPALS